MNASTPHPDSTDTVPTLGEVLSEAEIHLHHHHSGTAEQHQLRSVLRVLARRVLEDRIPDPSVLDEWVREELRISRVGECCTWNV